MSIKIEHKATENHKASLQTMCSLRMHMIFAIKVLEYNGIQRTTQQRTSNKQRGKKREARAQAEPILLFLVN